MTFDWLNWNLPPDVPDDKPYAKWRAAPSDDDTLSRAMHAETQRLLAAEYLAVDNLLEQHEGKVTAVRQQAFPTPLEPEYPHVMRRTSVMAREVALGTVDVVWTSEFVVKVVTK